MAKTNIDRRWLPLNALRAFEGVAKHLSFTAAANALLISQSALSRHVIALEKLIGAQLFERRPHALVLTKAGQLLLPAVMKSFDRLEYALDDIRNENATSLRTLRVQMPPSFAVHLAVPILRDFKRAAAEVEIDLETGKYSLVDYLCCADVGTVVHPAALGGQILGRSTLGFGHALGQKWVYDPQYGVMVSTRFYQNKPPTILDVPVDMQWEALNIPDPETPIGARGIGEPPVGGACASILNAISDALGDEIFRRAPVNLDTILTSLEAGRPMQHPLTAHI